MDEELEITVTASKTKFNLITKDEYEIKVISFDSREIVINCIKELIKFCEIKQEELYPWIACNDRMPADKKPNGEDNWVWVGKESPAHFHPLLVLMLRKPSGQWYRRVGVELKPIHKAMIPTHWHPIPTL